MEVCVGVHSDRKRKDQSKSTHLQAFSFLTSFKVLRSASLRQLAVPRQPEYFLNQRMFLNEQSRKQLLNFSKVFARSNFTILTEMRQKTQVIDKHQYQTNSELSCQCISRNCHSYIIDKSSIDIYANLQKSIDNRNANKAD